MATAPFICDVQDSEESLRIPEDHRKHKVSTKVFEAVIIMLVMGLIGCIIWINLPMKVMIIYIYIDVFQGQLFANVLIFN